MEIATYNTIKKVLTTMVAMAVAILMATEKAVGVIVVVIGALLLLSWLKTKVKGKLEDERVESVAGRAAKLAFGVLLPVLGVSSVVLYAVGGGERYYLRALGMVLSYVTLLGLFLYGGAYWWFDRQTGGKDAE